MMWWPKLFITIVIFISLTRCDYQIISEDPVVETTSGRIQGHSKNTIVHGKKYYAFQGIPFAEPPVGARRFQPPYPKNNWKGTLLTTKDGPACPQGANPVIGQEDCLTLNVFTPHIDREKKLAVVVWIYGGGFFEGSANTTMYGPDFFIEEDVIICHINYRIGIFGFLSTGDKVVPGNNGLRDQIAGLKWIRENIERFGGDPNSITLFGQSAGGASVSFHLQIEQSKGLFQRAIMQSGTSLCSWTRSRKSREIAFEIGNELNLNTTSTTVLVEEFRKLDYERLQTATSKIRRSRFLTYTPSDGFTFAPVIEAEHPHAIFTTKSHELMKKGKYHKVPSIIGFNTLDGIFIPELDQRLLTKYDKEPSGLVPVDMNIEDSGTKAAVGLWIKRKYLSSVPDALRNKGFIKFLSIDQFVRPIREFVRLMSKHRNTYFYIFSYEGPLGGQKNRTTPGTRHSEELGYLWPSKYEVATKHDILTRNRIVKLWANFVKNGNPSPRQEKLLQNIKWPTTDNKRNDDLVYLDIDRNLEIKQNPFNDDVNYWNDLYKQFAQGPLDTY